MIETGKVYDRNIGGKYVKLINGKKNPFDGSDDATKREERKERVEH